MELVAIPGSMEHHWLHPRSVPKVALAVCPVPPELAARGANRAAIPVALVRQKTRVATAELILTAYLRQAQAAAALRVPTEMAGRVVRQLPIQAMEAAVVEAPAGVPLDLALQAILEVMAGRISLPRRLEVAGRHRSHRRGRMVLVILMEPVAAVVAALPPPPVDRTVVRVVRARNGTARTALAAGVAEVLAMRPVVSAPVPEVLAAVMVVVVLPAVGSAAIPPAALPEPASSPSPIRQ